WETRWRDAAARGGVHFHSVGKSPDGQPLDELRQAIGDEHDGSLRPLWIVFIGHGTYDGREAKFNLVGPDVSAQQLAEWLMPLGRPTAIINCASASAPFIEILSGPDRIVITATKSGQEVNFTRFGEHLSRAIGSLDSDLDKDGQVSLLEAFLSAARHTQAWYDGLQQLATEHALLDDNGDRRGVREDFFVGLRPTKAAEQGLEVDGRAAHQWHLVPSDEERRFPDELRPRRDELELAIARLGDRKAELDPDVYYADLERLLVELAELYEQADAAAGEREDPPGNVPTQASEAVDAVPQVRGQ
ncbi:MAG: hypothetical protein KF861_08080, partial [Planctomycetaceae bacterium]|nr:hypothetical protein [Planctomycetaceae bacterium]